MTSTKQTVARCKACDARTPHTEVKVTINNSGGAVWSHSLTCNTCGRKS